MPTDSRQSHKEVVHFDFVVLEADSIMEAQGVAKHSIRGGEKLPTLAVCWRASEMRGEDTGHFREVEGVSIVVDLYVVTLDSPLALNKPISIFQLVISLC